MAYIRVDQAMPVFDGQPVTFKSPASCVGVEGLKIYYPEGDSIAVSTFDLVDAHGNNVGGKNLFAENVLVKVILDTELNRAYVQNADTNAYLEGRLEQKFVEATMLASKWEGNTYSFEEEYPHASWNISIEVAPTATVNEFEIFGEAMICGSADSNIATALGDVPTEDIPIIVKVVAK